jgi:hypothetical protein
MRAGSVNLQILQDRDPVQIKYAATSQHIGHPAAIDVCLFFRAKKIASILIASLITDAKNLCKSTVNR